MIGWPTTCGTGELLPGLRTYILPNGGHGRAGHPQAPSKDVDPAFFAEQLHGDEQVLETPEIATAIVGETLEVTVTFPEVANPRQPNLLDVRPWSRWLGLVSLRVVLRGQLAHDDRRRKHMDCIHCMEPGRSSIDIVTTHTVTLDEGIMPSAPPPRISIK